MSDMNVDVRVARHVACLAKHLSFTKAAAELGLTQSALSRSIQQLEDTAKVRLFDRSRNGVHPTVVGRAVIHQAEAMLRESAEMTKILSRAVDPDQQTLTFGMSRLPAPTFLPLVIPRVLEIKPGLKFEIMNRSPDELIALLMNETLEFIVCAGRVSKAAATLKGVQLGTYPAVQVVRVGHPLLEPGTERTTRDFPWIRSHRSSSGFAGNTIWPHLRSQPQITVDEVVSAARLAANTDMIWITVSFNAAQALQNELLVQLPWSEGLAIEPIRLMFYSLRGRTLSPAAQLLLTQFRKTAASLM